MNESPSRTVVVIGGARAGGISHAVVQRLVASGDTVAVVDIDEAGARQTAEQLTGLAGSATAFGCDVTDRTAVFEIMGAVKRALGPVWGLLYAPAWAPAGAPEDLDAESWHQALDVTLSGALWCSQAVFPMMKEAGGGRIVLIGSEVSDRPTDGVSIAYLAAKGGIRSLTRGLAWAWGRHGITVNTLWPYATTPGHTSFADARAHPAQAQIQQNALGRVGEPFDDLAPIVQFLLNPESGYLSGATVPANGGRSMP